MKTRVFLAILAGGLIPLQGAEWTLGFEPKDGFKEGKSIDRSVVSVLGGTVTACLVRGRGLGSSVVSVLGGTVTVESKDAAKGQQFLRFQPAHAENALVLNLGPEAGARGTRAIQFSIRLSEAGTGARLVMSYGQTVALKPIVDGIKIDPNQADAGVVNVAIARGVWLDIGIYEDLNTGGWELFVGDKLVLADLAIEGPTELLRDLLVFSDGALDLDAVVVSSTGEVIDEESAKPGKGNGRENGNSSGDKPTKNTTLSDRKAWALAHARQGNYATLVSFLETGVDEDSPAAIWHFNIAQYLASIAYDMAARGDRRGALVLGHQSLVHLANGQDSEEVKASPSALLNYEFVTAQIFEKIIGDYHESSRRYSNVVDLDDSRHNARVGVARSENGKKRETSDETKGGEG